MEGLIKLSPEIAQCWSLWPLFEGRVTAFNQRYLSECSPGQLKTMVQSLRHRWINDPISAGYWLAMRAGEAVGHACGWLSMDWNQPYAFIYQVETAPGFTAQWMSELDDWVDEMNGFLAARGSPGVGFIEFSTFNDPAAMQRLLEKSGRTNVRVRSTVRFDT